MGSGARYDRDFWPLWLLSGPTEPSRKGKRVLVWSKKGPGRAGSERIIFSRGVSAKTGIGLRVSDLLSVLYDIWKRRIYGSGICGYLCLWICEKVVDISGSVVREVDTHRIMDKVWRY